MLEIVQPVAFPKGPTPEMSPVYGLRFPEDGARPTLTVFVRDHRVHVGPQSLDLARSPHMLRLFRGFCGAGDRGLTAAHILYFAYDLSEEMGSSKHIVGSKRSYSVKLISRARIAAETHLTGALLGRIAWFPYDVRSKSWRLAMLRPS